jgi:chromosome partitioning protein
VTVNVAYALAHIHKKKVLVIDGDPQFNATQYLMKENDYIAYIADRKKATLRDIFVPRRPGAVRTVSGSARSADRKKMPLSTCTSNIYDGGEGRGKLDLIPSALDMIEIENSQRGTENMLNFYIQEKAKGYDYVLIDCPPTISIYTQAAIIASDKYIVPVKPDPLSIIGLPLLEGWLEDYLSRNGLNIEPIGIVFTMVRGAMPRRMKEVMADARQERGDAVFSAHLSEATDVAESVEAHRPVFLYNPHGKTAKEIIAITQEFVNRTTGD